MNNQELKKRTKTFALDIISLLKPVPRDETSKIFIGQLLRCSTSVAANYRAACRAKSKADFIYKIAIVEEEADESLFWLEMITETELISSSLTQQLLKEANELTAIFTAIRKTSINRT